MGSGVQAKEAADGYRWFFGMGLVAICFAIFLATVDKRLSESDSERRLGAALRELRTAQAGLPSRVTDSRQTQSFMHAALPDSQAGHDHEASHGH